MLRWINNLLTEQHVISLCINRKIIFLHDFLILCLFSFQVKERLCNLIFCYFVAQWLPLVFFLSDLHFSLHASLSSCCASFFICRPVTLPLVYKKPRCESANAIQRKTGASKKSGQWLILAPYWTTRWHFHPTSLFTLFLSNEAKDKVQMPALPHNCVLTQQKTT